MGEYLVAAFLSRAGWEVVRVDHTGIDLIAARDNRRIGVSVKSRFHRKGNSAVHVFSKGEDSRAPLVAACKAFAVEPWIAVYHETQNSAQLVVMSVERYDARYNSKAGAEDLKTTPKAITDYKADPEVGLFELTFGQATGQPLLDGPSPRLAGSP